MIKRAASSILWFFTIAWGWNYVALVTDAPALAGLVLGAAVAAFVWTDPWHRIWPVTRSAARPVAAAAPASMSTAASSRI